MAYSILTQVSIPATSQTANQHPTYGSVFLKMTNIAAEDRMPAINAKAMKRFNEMVPVKNSNTKMAKTSVSTTAVNKILFFLFMIQCFDCFIIFIILLYITRRLFTLLVA